MGVGGAFILVPAMIYIIGMPTKLVPGTSLFVTIFVSVIVTFLHAFNYGSIDLILVLMLVIGSIIGVQTGQKIGQSIESSGLKALLAVLLLIGVSVVVLMLDPAKLWSERLRIGFPQCPCHVAEGL